MPLKRLIFVGSVILILITAGCNTAPPPAPTTAPTFALPVLVIPTPSPAGAAEVTHATPSLTPAPTLAPVEGTTTTQLNVRTEPSTSGATLGMIPPYSKVQILSKDTGGNWYQILYAQGPEGKGWLKASYVQVPDAKAIPALGGAIAMQGGPSGMITQQVNVRSGPGTDFNALGTLNPQDTVTLTGKSSDGTWLQIAFTSGPEGRGWVAAGYVRSEEAAGLPIVGERGQVVGTGTPTGIPATMTPTVVAAFSDSDSAASPGVSTTFSPSGSGALQFTSDVSSPAGDTEDWVAFVPYLSGVSMRLDCVGNAELNTELLLDGVPAVGWPGLTCGEQKVVNVSPQGNYLLRLGAPESTGNLQYIRFTLNISTVR